MVYLRSPTVVVDSFVHHGSTRVPSTEKQHKKRCDTEEKLEFEFQRTEGAEGREEGGRGGTKKKSGIQKKNAFALRRDSRVAIRRINDSVSGVTPGLSSSLPQRSLEYRVAVGALPVGRKSSRLDRANGVASAFINQCYVRLVSTWRDVPQRVYRDVDSFGKRVMWSTFAGRL